VTTHTSLMFPVKAQFGVRQIKGDFILHDPRTDTVHRLNSVAAIIWQLCDGTRDRFAIFTEIADIFGQSPSDVAGDVDEILVRFMDAGLVHSSAVLPEIDLLLRCVQAAIGNECTGGIRTQLWNNIDWTFVEQTAVQHGVLPLVYRGLREIQQNDVPADVLERLEHSFSAIAERNRFLFEELLGLLALFEANDIPAVPFKGPALAMALHGDVALRQFGDLDLFIPADRVGRAKKVLLAHGCRFRHSSEDGVLAEYEGHYGCVGIDLQWAFAPKWKTFPIDIEQFWARVERVSLGSADVLQPSPGDQLRILSAHAAKHCWSKLGWIIDMAVFIQRHRQTLDWRGELAQSKQLGGERLVLLGARLASDVLGTDLPEDVLSAMDADTTVGKLATELRRRLFDPVREPNSVRGSHGSVEAGLMYIKARERVRDKLPYVWHLLGHPFRRLGSLVTPNYHDRDVVTLPRSITFLYYLVRPMRLTADCWADLMQRFHYLSK
jgi:Uncharacterised nucleotidyltransferase/Coenzyme PQQ synthesis protein D (PqqD)